MVCRISQNNQSKVASMCALKKLRFKEINIDPYIVVPITMIFETYKNKRIESASFTSNVAQRIYKHPPVKESVSPPSFLSFKIT